MLRAVAFCLLTFVFARLSLGAEGKRYRGRCKLGFTILSEGRRDVRDGKLLSAEELKPGMRIIHSRYGFLEVESVDGGMLGYVRIDEPGRTRGRVAINPNDRIAEVGTVQAQQIIEQRLQERFRHPENIPVLFAFSIVMNRTGAFSGKVNDVNAVIKARYAEIWKTLEPSVDFDAQLQAWLTSFREDAPPSSAHIDSFKRFAQAVYDATGEDLVRSALMNVFAAGEGAAAAPWPKLGEVPRGSGANNAGRNDIKLLGGNVTMIPKDIDHFARLNAWDEGVGAFDKHNPLSLGRAKWELAPARYLSSRHPDHPTDSTSQALLKFKDSADIADIRPVLDAHKAEFRRFVDTVKAREGADSLVFVPVPGSTPGKPSATNALAAEWGAEFGAPVSTKVVTRDPKKPVDPQKTQPHLWDRLENVTIDSNFRFTIGDVKGKTVMLVDDVSTSGATLARIRKELVDRGAKAVYFMAVAHTGSGGN